MNKHKHKSTHTHARSEQKTFGQGHKNRHNSTVAAVSCSSSVHDPKRIHIFHIRYVNIFMYFINFCYMFCSHKTITEERILFEICQSFMDGKNVFNAQYIGGVHRESGSFTSSNSTSTSSSSTVIKILYLFVVA